MSTVNSTCCVSVEAHAVQPDHQGVARPSALNVKRPGQRIPARGDVRSVRIHTSSVHGRRMDGFAGSDSQRRLDLARELIVVDLGHKIMAGRTAFDVGARRAVHVDSWS